MPHLNMPKFPIVKILRHAFHLDEIRRAKLVIKLGSALTPRFSTYSLEVRVIRGEQESNLFWTQNSHFQNDYR